MGLSTMEEQLEFIVLGTAVETTLRKPTKANH